MAPNTPEENNDAVTQETTWFCLCSHHHLWLQWKLHPTPPADSAPPQSFSGRCSCSHSQGQLFLPIIGPLLWSPVHHCVPMTLLWETSHPLIPLVLTLSCFNQLLVPIITWNGSCPYHLHLARVKGQFSEPQLLISGRLAHLATPPWRSFFSGFLWCHLPWFSSCSPLLLFRSLHFPSPPPTLEWQLVQGSVFGPLVFTFTHTCYGSQSLLWLHSLYLLSD